MILKLAEGEDAAKSVLALVVALVEIIQELLSRQAVRRLQGGSLSESRGERLGVALMAIEDVIARLKAESDIAGAVAELREGLDTLLEDVFAGAGWEGGERDETACAM